MNSIFDTAKARIRFIPVNSPFYTYRMRGLKKYIQTMFLVATLFNLMLLIPDWVMLGPTHGIIISFVRVVYSCVLLAIGIRINVITTFRVYSVLIAALEVIGILIYFFVYGQYGQPNFLIQTMGIIIMIVLVCFIPNRWVYVLLVSVFAAAGFWVSTFLFANPIDRVELVAGLVYVSIAVLICVLSSWSSEQHQFKEFLAKRNLERLCSTDYLTNTANRYKMEEEALRWMEFCRRHSFPLCLVFMDVDNLKTINDQCGHTAGDFVLEQLASTVQGHLRRSDTIARWGGDEFLLLLPNSTVQDAVEVTERIRNSVRTSNAAGDYQVTCSFGVVEMKEDDTFENMISQADKLMYRCKLKGKDMVEWDK